MGVVGSIWRQAQRELDTNSAIQDSKPGQPRKTNKNHHQLGCNLSCDSVSRTYILGPDTTYTYRIKTSEAGVVGVAPTGSPTFCLNFCLHWVQLSPRNCMDLHTRGCRHGIYQMCRIMIRSAHFNRGNARNAVARMGSGYTSLHCNSASLGEKVAQQLRIVGGGSREGRLAIES